jgi:hypothetical protein
MLAVSRARILAVKLERVELTCHRTGQPVPREVARIARAARAELQTLRLTAAVRAR